MNERIAPAAAMGAGGAATLFEPGSNCFLVTRAARAAFLVDAEQYYLAFAQAAERAAESIVIVGWDFDSRTRLTWGDERGMPPFLGDFLNFLLKRRRTLRVYVLAWDYPMLFGKEAAPLYGPAWKPHRRVQIHYDNSHPVGASHHQKIVVIDDALAFCGSLDLACRRWDTCAHSARDPRRTLAGEAYPPLHETMAAVEGEAAFVLGQIARKRWHAATGEVIPPVKRPSDAWPPGVEPHWVDATVAISRTLPETEVTHEAREVEALYLDLIGAAKRYIYIENPYFTSDRIGAALAARLAAPHPPEVVLVTSRVMRGWLQEQTTHALRARLLERLRQADRNRRFEAYYPDVPELEGACLECHSNIMIVDDEWLSIGSANLSNRSMSLDSECDLTFEARGKVRATEAIRELRDRLLAEHLATASERVRAAVERGTSLLGAIRELHGEGRTLKPLAHEPSLALDRASVGEPEPPVSMDRLIDEFAPDLEVHRAGPAWGKILAIALTIAGLAAAWRYTPLSGYIAPERIMEWAQNVGEVRWAPVAVMLAYTPAAFVMFPRPLITLFAVIAFGPVLGFSYAIGGILGAALATYFAGLALPRDTVRHLAGDKLNEMTEVLRRRGLLAVFAMRIVPVAPFVVEGMVCGAIRIKLWHYALGTVLGMAPGTLTTSVFGDQIQTALTDPSRINYWLIAGVVVFFVVLIWYVRRWFLKEHAAAQHHGHAHAEQTPS